jgi:hypothetical protein
VGREHFLQNTCCAEQILHGLADLGRAFRPCSGLGISNTPFHTAYAVGHYLSPLGLGTVKNHGSARPPTVLDETGCDWLLSDQIAWTTDGVSGPIDNRPAGCQPGPTHTPAGKVHWAIQR